MVRAPFAFLIIVVAAVAGLAAGGLQKNRPADSIDLVAVDVVVVDKKGQPVHGLTQKDFTLKEDGHVVELTTFQDVSPDPGDEYQPRSVTLFLDDAVAPSVATAGMQAISRGVIQFAHPKDEIAVVRLNRVGEEPFGDRRLAEERIAGFQAAAYPFIGYLTQRETLRRVTEIADQLQAGEQGRKVLLCIGAPIVCNVDEPTRSSASNLWDAWVGAIASAARANLSVYAIVPGRAFFRRGGLVEQTGGMLFPATYDVGPAVERILSDAANYYVLGYWPSGKGKEIHSVDVKVNRGGVEVSSRRRRGR